MPVPAPDGGHEGLSVIGPLRGPFRGSNDGDGELGASVLEVDLHGYHPSTVEDQRLVRDIVRQAWEMGLSGLRLIHGHGWWRLGPRPFANTNTGYLGLTIRRALRNNKTLRTLMYMRIDVTDPGVTTVRLKANLAPTRTRFEALPDRDFPENR